MRKDQTIDKFLRHFCVETHLQPCSLFHVARRKQHGKHTGHTGARTCDTNTTTQQQQQHTTTTATKNNRSGCGLCGLKKHAFLTVPSYLSYAVTVQACQVALPVAGSSSSTSASSSDWRSAARATAAVPQATGPRRAGRGAALLPGFGCRHGPQRRPHLPSRTPLECTSDDTLWYRFRQARRGNTGWQAIK